MRRKGGGKSETATAFTAEAQRAQRKTRLRGDVDFIVVSWGAALRSRTEGSQNESRFSAIHEQRPYRGLREGAAAGVGEASLA